MRIDELNLKSLLQEYKQLGLLTGPLIGGAAFSLLMGSIKPIKDIDVFGPIPEHDDVDHIDPERIRFFRNFLMVTDTKHKTDLDYTMYRAARGNSLRLFRSNTMVVDGIETITPYALIEQWLVDIGHTTDSLQTISPRHLKWRGRILQLIQKHNIQFADYRWRHPETVLWFFQDIDHDNSPSKAQRLLNDYFNRWRK